MEESFERQENLKDKKGDDGVKRAVQPDAERAAAAAARAAARKARMEGKAQESDKTKNTSSTAKQTTVIANHTVVSGDTLSGIALQYYGSGDRDKWMAIYEANKEAIGENPSLIRIGQVLKIPTID